MKHIKIIFTAFVLLAATGFSSAQTKVAHINSAELMKDYPKVQEADKILKQYTDAYSKRISRLEGEILEIQQTLQDSIDYISKAYAELLEQTYRSKYQELNRLHQEYQTKIEQKHTELYTPIIAELKKIISDVAKEKGFDYVLDTAEGGNVIFSNPTFDLMEAVKKRIAEIAAKEAAAEGATGTGN